MKVHVVKSSMRFFYDYKNGNKTNSLRKDDRGYSVGDLCVIFPTEDGDRVLYGEEPAVKKISHIVRDSDFKDMPEGYCLLSFKEV